MILSSVKNLFKVLFYETDFEELYKLKYIFESFGLNIFKKTKNQYYEKFRH